ncbi:MAG TPA: diaminobutyrate acetyltransferase [Pseudogracilibacillus sp.]|nr:diaminobutyrate acetyltransferase [Pseudogracilibacillus sp.]
MIKTKEEELFTLRQPTEKDGSDMFRIVKESNVLDVNSSYSYLMWGKFFRSTSIIAECESERVVGFVSGFLLPERNDTLFVWQVGVEKEQRGKGLATKLIIELLRNVRQKEDVHYLEATVTPSNIPSSKLFKGIAKKLATDCIITECFPEDLFPDDAHESELSYRIGPF